MQTAKQGVMESGLDVRREPDFKDIFSKIVGAAPVHADKQSVLLQASWMDTLLGPMCAIGDEAGLHLLEFVERRGLERAMRALRHKQNAVIVLGDASPLSMIREELRLYFSGALRVFKTPIHVSGTDFQRQVWGALRRVPYGQTRSYGDQADMIGRSTASRAVANANGANSLAIVIPCHRIICSNGELGGYGGGIARKRWLIDHEKRA